MEDSEYSMFLRRYAKRINECDAWYHSIDESYQIYKEKGESQFLTDLEEQEDFQSFCGEYYSFLREHYNACGGMMWDEFKRFRSEFNSDRSAYWKSLEKELEKR
jgi:hypothetical protein